MTRAGYRHRIIIQDRSGSMGDSAEILYGAQSGLDEFIHGEADPHRTGKVTVSLWEFDTKIRCVASFAEPEGISYQIVPRGGTNLYGAVGLAVTAEGEKLAALPEDERPEDVTVLIASDGRHNVTVAGWTGERAKALLKQQQDDYSWRVLYMGCGEDAFREGEQLGTKGGLTVNTVSPGAGWRMSKSYLARVPYAAAAASAGGLEALDLSEEERALGEGRVPEKDSKEN